jgi:hypothetical protein
MLSNRASQCSLFCVSCLRQSKSSLRGIVLQKDMHLNFPLIPSCKYSRARYYIVGKSRKRLRESTRLIDVPSKMAGDEI